MLSRAAESSRHMKSQHSAAIIKGGRILAVRSNSYGKHAEVAVLNAVDEKMRMRSRVWVVRLMADGSLGNSLPCSDCRIAMMKAGVRVVFYSDEDGNIQKLIY